MLAIVLVDPALLGGGCEGPCPAVVGPSHDDRLAVGRDSNGRIGPEHAAVRQRDRVWWSNESRHSVLSAFIESSPTAAGLCHQRVRVKAPLATRSTITAKLPV